jgi:hypothetical protein
VGAPEVTLVEGAGLKVLGTEQHGGSGALHNRGVIPCGAPSAGPNNGSTFDPINYVGVDLVS